MAIQILGKLALSSRGFMQGLRASSAAFRSFAAGIPRILGETGVGYAFGNVLDKIFGAKQKELATAAGAVTGGKDPEKESSHTFKRLIQGSIAAGAALTAMAIANTKRLKDLAEQMDLTVQEVELMDIAAKQSGVSLQKLATFFDRLDQSRKAALQGNKELRQTFHDLGVTIEDLQTMSSKGLARKLLPHAFAGGLTTRTLLRELGGRGAERLGPALQNYLMGTGGPAAVVSTKNRESIDNLTKAMERLYQRLKVAGVSAVGAVLGRAQRMPLIRGAGSLLQKAVNLLPGESIDIVQRRLRLQETEERLLRLQGEAKFKDILAEEERVKLAEAYNQLYKEQTELHDMQLSKAQQRERYEQKINAQLIKAKEYLVPGATRSDLMEGVKAEIEATKLAQQLAGLSSAPGLLSVVDSLARVGGFTARAGNTAFNLQERMVLNLEKIAFNTDPHNREITGILK